MPPLMTTINNILGTFAPITLEQMSSVKLMNRTDTKFVTNMAKLHLLLQVNGRLIGTPVMELVVIDVITILAITLLERTLKMETSKLVQYDRIELIKPEKRKELIADLELRLGIAVTDVKVGAIEIPTATVTSWVWDTRISSKRAGYASHSARPAPLRPHRQTRPSTWLPHQRQPEPAQPT